MNGKHSLFKNPIIVIFMFFTALTINSVNAQLVTNGSFEDTEVGDYSDSLMGINGWVLQLMDGASAKFEVVADTAQDGNKSLRILEDTVGTDQWSIQVVADSIPAIQGETYYLSVWAKANVAGQQINITVGNYSYDEYGALRPVDLTTDWKEYKLTYTVNDSVTAIRAPIHFSYAGNLNHAIFIDNMVIKSKTEIENALKPVIVEAESGDVGAEYSILTEGTTDYVAIQTTTAEFYPVSSARMITYNVTFPDTGTFDLFARIRVGAETFNDDSFFYGNGFGEKDSLNSADWILMNGLAAAGFSDPDDVVREAGGLGENVWKWVNLSKNTFQGDTALVFTIVEDSLTQTFQIGAREDGLEIDKLAFGKSYLYYTVSNLDNVEPGTIETPFPAYEGPALAINQPKFVGNIYSSPQIENFESYWNEVIPENAGKWGSVEAVRDTMTWGGLDAAYDLAKDNGLPFNFHVLIWGAQQPAWMDTLSTEEQLAEIQEWFEAVAERYPAIDYLQVVNEPLPGHNPPDGTNGRANYKEALGGDGDTGWDWIITAFRMARDIFPATTKLMINDFSIINTTSSTNTYKNIVQLLQAENLIDVIGEQGHAFTTTQTNNIMRSNLNTLYSTGLPIQITEMDVDGVDDAVQLQNYKRIFPLLYEHPGVEGITLWGWRRGLWRDDEGAYLLNNNGSERPALEWLRTYLDTVTVDPVGVEESTDKAFTYSLSNNYPNPFNPTTMINYSIAKSSKVVLKVFDILGREVQTLVNEVKAPGEYNINFNAQYLSSGVYIYQIRTEGFVQSKKMILQK